MNGFVQAATVLLPSAYLVTTVLYGMAFAGERAPAFAARWRARALVATLGLHAALFAARAAVARTFPIDGAWLVVSATALVAGLLFALLSLRTARPAVGGIVLAMLTVLQTAASALGPTRAEALPAADAGKLLHVGTVVLASASLVLSGLFGYLHVLLLRQMRAKRFGALYRSLPNLEQLARLTRLAALAGFVFLTAGLNVGIALAHARVEGFGYLDAHVLLTIAVWLHFGLIAFSRHVRGLTAQRASVAAVFGLITLLLAIVITVIPAATFHRLS